MKTRGNGVELTDTTLDKYDVLRKQIKEKWPDWFIDGFIIQPNGNVIIRLEKFETTGYHKSILGGLIPYRGHYEYRHIDATWSDRKQSWKLTGDIE